MKHLIAVLKLASLLAVLVSVTSPVSALSFYNPSSGRWLNRDPLDERTDVNRYAFIGNKSICNYDVVGLYSSAHTYTLSEMQHMLLQSREDFRRKLKVLCPISTPISWTTTKGEKQCCTPTACRVQAEVLAFDFAQHLEIMLAAQYRRFGNIIAFFELPPWVPTPRAVETINSRAHNAPNNGMVGDDYDKGYGLKCSGVQSLIATRFVALMGPLRRSGFQCFKGAYVGNRAEKHSATHNWFGIYGPFDDDLSSIGVEVDPWFSAGGIISPDGHGFGQARYLNPVLW